MDARARQVEHPIEARVPSEEVPGSSGLVTQLLAPVGAAVAVDERPSSDGSTSRTNQGDQLGEMRPEKPSLGRCLPTELALSLGDRERDRALLWEAVHRLANVVSSFDSKLAELMAHPPMPQGGARDQQLHSSQQHQQQQQLAPSCSTSGDAAIGKKTVEALSPLLTQQRDELMSVVRWLQSQMEAVTQQLHQIGSTQKHLLLQQQVLLEELHGRDKAASMGSESFRANVNCYDVAVLADDRLLLATNKGVREYSPEGCELSRFLREDLAVAVDAFSYDGRVAVLLRSNGAAKAKVPSDKAKQPTEGTTVVIMNRDTSPSQSSTDWLEEGRFLVTLEVTCLSTVPESGHLLVACGLGKPDVYSLSRSGSRNFQMKARYGVKAIAATSSAVVIASSDPQPNGCYVVEAYCSNGAQLLWERLCKDQVYDLCCDPWGGVYAAVKDRGHVMVISSGRQVPGDQSDRSPHGGVTELVSGLTKPAYLSMDGRARRLVILSYDGRAVNALRCRTSQIELNPII